MRINGKELLKKNQKRVKLTRGSEELEILLSPIPPGWNERMRSLGLLEWPSPPKRPVMHNNRPVVNPKTHKVELVEDEADPEYRRKSVECGRRVQCLRLAACLKDDPQVEFEAKEPTGQSREEWEAYADRLKKEMTDPATGFTDEEVGVLLDHAESLGATVIDMDVAVDFFSPET